jgi:TonB-linked SusC/RagA family outer membrane protein
MKCKFILLLLFYLVHLRSSAQNPIKGKVVDGQSQEELVGVNISIKNTTKATFTNANGGFEILASPTDILVFSFIGYETQEILVGNKTSIEVKLNTLSQNLEEFVVTGYTMQSKAKVTSSVSKMGEDEVKNTPSANAIQSFQGKMAGVSIPITSGQPGMAAKNIVIRGGTKVNVYGTAGNNAEGSNADDVNPLVVIDGVFRTRQEFDDLNPSDIESVQVMKDAASIAIYGARGANGVIVVKTRSGKFNSKMSVNFSHRTTFEQASRSYNYLNAADYLVLARVTANTSADVDANRRNTLLHNGGFSAGTRVYSNKGDYGKNIYTTALLDNIINVEGREYVDNLLRNGYATMDDPINPGTKLLFYNGPTYQDLIWQTGHTNDNNLSISGGSQNANYNLSAGYTFQEGTLVGTNYERANILGNFGFKLTEKLKLDALVNYQNVMPNNVQGDFTNAAIRGNRISPLIRIFKDDGMPQSGESYTVRNWLHTLEYDTYKINTERITTRLGLTYDIIKGLSYRPSLSYVLNDYRNMFMRRAVPDSDWSKPSTTREKTQNSSNYRQIMVDQILQYDLNLSSKSSLTSLVGFNYTRNYTNSVSIGSQRATNDYVFTIDEPAITVINGVPTTNVTAFGTRVSETRSASYFGQVQYDYDTRYLLSGSLRYDGFSNFAPSHKYATFPSLSGGWNIHREDFFTLPQVSNLKLRASWGVAGTSDLSYTDTYGGYTAVQYAQSSGIRRANLANPNLKWEKTEITDIAIDLGLFNNRVNLTVDWYNKLTKDRLDSKPLPAESPFSSIIFNNGVLQNKGLEIEAGAHIIKAKDFNWRMNVAWAKNNQKILKLPENERDKNRQGGAIIADPLTGKDIEVGGFAEGERPYAIYAFKVDGIFATDEEAAIWNQTHVDQLATANGISVGKRAGDYIFRDVNGDHIIDQKDVVFIGYRTPNVTGGIQNTISYKQFSLRVNADFALGHMISNGALARALGTGRAFNEGAPSEALGDDIWRQAGDVNKRYARFSLGDADIGQKNYIRSSAVGVNNMYGSDVSAMFDKGDFLAFREVTLSYTLPTNAVKVIKAQSLNVFASVYNLGYLTKYKGMNPEVYTGYDPGGYPRPRQISLGANIKF